MVRASNCVYGFINTLFVLLGLAAIACSVYIHVHGAKDCQKAILLPLLITGAVIALISLMGLIGSFCRANCLLKLNMFLILLSILGLIAFAVFAIIVTRTTDSVPPGERRVWGLGFKEHFQYDYSIWLQRNFVNAKNWKEIRSCLVDVQVCRSLGHDVDESVQNFYQKNLTPIQSGCCKPPIRCGFTYRNATYWTGPGGRGRCDIDCQRWSNNQQRLCYDCRSCKAGVLDNIRNEWRLLAVANIAVALLLIVTFSTGFCVVKNNTEHNLL